MAKLLISPNAHIVSFGLWEPADDSPAAALYSTRVPPRLNSTFPGIITSFGVAADLVQVISGPVQTVAALLNGAAKVAKAKTPARKQRVGKKMRL